MKTQIKYLFISFLLIIIQSQAMKLLSLEGLTPDILAIWIVYIALRHGQMTGTIWGFGIGLIFDLLTGTSSGSPLSQKPYVVSPRVIFITRTRQRSC